MEQTPIHQAHNADLLKFMPTNARRVVEVGCSSGALAREYRKLNPGVHYIGIELVPAYAELARAHCDEVMALDIEAVDEQVLRSELAADCWVFGDVLEHLKDPWLLLRKIRAAMGETGYVVTCIPNMQHWSVQARLSFGNVRYEDAGLFDRTHLRWFSRVTMLEMFTQSGFRVEDGMARIFDEPQREAFLPIIKAMASAAQADANTAVQDALPLQYVLRAVPDAAQRVA
jgi:SAM-dependent methyltransferase